MQDEQKQETDIVQKEKKQNNVAELSQKYKGRIPSGVKDQVVQYNKQQKLQKVLQDRKGAVVERRNLDLFLEEFLKNGGNATEAALTIHQGHLKNHASAAAMGHYYMKQARLLGRMYLEKKGYGYGKLLESMAKKAVDPDMKDPAWMDRVLKIAGYENFLPDKNGGATTVNVMNIQKDLLDQYVQGEFEPIRDLPEEDLNVEEDHGSN